MKRYALGLILAAIAVLCIPLASRADTFDSTWKAPDAQPVDFAGKKVAALVLAKNRAAVAAAEEKLADEITSRGGEGIMGHSIVTESDLADRDKVKSLFQAAGVAGVVVMRPVLAGGRHAGPDIWKDPQYRRFMGFSSEPPGPYDKKAAFYVEVLVYSLEQDKLIWAGKSATKASTVDELMSNMATGTAEQLTKEGLIHKAE